MATKSLRLPTNVCPGPLPAKASCRCPGFSLSLERLLPLPASDRINERMRANCIICARRWPPNFSPAGIPAVLACVLACCRDVATSTRALHMLPVGLLKHPAANPSEVATCDLSCVYEVWRSLSSSTEHSMTLTPVADESRENSHEKSAPTLLFHASWRQPGANLARSSETEKRHCREVLRLVGTCGSRDNAQERERERERSTTAPREELFAAHMA